MLGGQLGDADDEGDVRLRCNNLSTVFLQVEESKIARTGYTSTFALSIATVRCKRPFVWGATRADDVYDGERLAGPARP